MKKFDFHKLRRYLPWIATIAMVLAIVISPMGGHALDFGDFGGDNDYGGDDDWGGGGDSDSDSSGDGLGAIIWWLFKVVYDLFGVPGVIVLAIILLALYFAAKKKKKGSGQPYQQHTPQPQGAQRTDRSTLAQMYTYQQVDPNFDIEGFKEKLSNLYVQCQNAWTDKNMESLRPYLTDAMYAQFDRQLESYRAKHQTNRVERIAVLGVELVGWKQAGGKDTIVAELRTRIVDYVVDDNTGTIIRGSDRNEKFMTYEWTLVRTSGQTTGQASGMTGQICPSCGAHVDINHTAVCEYCGTVLTTDTFDWVISNIKGISQQTK